MRLRLHQSTRLRPEPLEGLDSRLGCFGRMLGDDSPLSRLTDVGLRELPVVGEFLSVHGASALQTNADHRGIAVETNTNIRCLVVKELHPPGACKLQYVSL